MTVLDLRSGTVTGNRYAENYDVLHTDPARGLAVVADGMGSGIGSATAGTTAVAAFAELAAPGAGPLRAAVAEVQRRVRAAGARIPDLTGCTLTGFVADGDTAWIVQLGDSRAYRLRDGLLELLTTDHTRAWLGAVNGWWPHDSPDMHAARYHLLRYCGHPDEPEADLLNVSLRPGDVCLLCTDGIAEQVPYDRLLAVLSRPRPPVDVLLADSLSAGGADNATAVLIEVS